MSSVLYFDRYLFVSYFVMYVFMYGFSYTCVYFCLGFFICLKFANYVCMSFFVSLVMYECCNVFRPFVLSFFSWRLRSSCLALVV